MKKIILGAALLIVALAILPAWLMRPVTPIPGLPPRAKAPEPPKLLRYFDGNKYGFRNRDLVVVIEPRFSRAGEFSEGLAMVSRESDTIEYIDERGDTVIKIASKDGGRFSSGRAAIIVGGKWGYIDRAGKVVIEARYDYVSEFVDGMACVGIARGSLLNRIADVGLDCKYHFIDTDGNAVEQPR